MNAEIGAVGLPAVGMFTSTLLLAGICFWGGVLKGVAEETGERELTHRNPVAASVSDGAV
jgi:hypothetical protein